MISLQWANEQKNIVTVDEDGNIYFTPWPLNGFYGEKVKGFIDSGIDIQAFAPLAPTRSQLDIEAARNYLNLKTVLQMSPLQSALWVDANVNTLADAKDVLKTLIVAMSILGKNI